MNDSRSGALELDYLIVGGGIQGLTLLDRLVAAGARRTLLVTRDALGVGESLHSHGYMHLGYSLPTADAELARELGECGAWWWERIERIGSSYVRQPPTYFGVSREALEERLGIWVGLGLPYEALDGPPDALRGGEAAHDHVCHFRIHDRTVSMRELLEDLSAPLQERIVRAELTRIDLDESGRRVAACHLTQDSRRAETCIVRPRILLLASGRSTQPLLRSALAPDGRRPFETTHQQFHRVRYVPMLLVRGRGLPRITTILQSHALSIATHTVTPEESMWIVTYSRDHVSDRGDFDATRESVPGPALRVSLDLLERLVPAVRERSNVDLRYGFYFGGKIDHPAGGNARYLDDCGVANLRVLWPGLWSLALANARTIVDELETDASPPPAPPGRPRTELTDLPLPRGNTVGEELRLTDAQAWWSYAELAGRLGLEHGTPP